MMLEQETEATREGYVLGAVLNDFNLYDDVFSVLGQQDFVQQHCKEIHEAIQRLKAAGVEGIDFMLVANRLAKTTKRPEGEWIAILANLVSNAPPAVTVKSYVAALKRDSVERSTVDAVAKIMGKAYVDPENMIGALREALSHSEAQLPAKRVPYSSHLIDALKSVNDLQESGGALLGLSTGFDDLDKYINGLQKGDLIILGARPSIGKTMLALNIADNIGFTQQRPSIFFSMEMSAQKVALRTLSRFSNISMDRLQKYSPSPGDNYWSNLGETVEKMKSSKLDIHDRCALTVQQVRSYCRQVQNDGGLEAVFIDYLGLMTGDGENETIKIGNITKDLKQLARDFNVPVVVLCQLNRDIEKRKDKHPMLSDLRQSGNIEQDADIILFLARNEDIAWQADLEVAKNRNGETGKIHLIINNEVMAFEGHK